MTHTVLKIHLDLEEGQRPESAARLFWNPVVELVEDSFAVESAKQVSLVTDFDVNHRALEMAIESLPDDADNWDIRRRAEKFAGVIRGDF